jgi:hypothetical protein
MPSDSIARLAADPKAQAALRSGEAFAPHRLRSSSRSQVQALLHYSYEDLPPGHDGCVAWASNGCIKISDLSGQVRGGGGGCAAQGIAR